MKKHVRPMKLSRETVLSLTPGALTVVAGGGFTYGCSKIYSCVASCSDVPCG